MRATGYRGRGEGGGSRRGRMICLMLAAIGCAGATLKSSPRDREIVIDGRADEWRDSLIYLKENGVAVGVSNDREFFYLCLTSSNQELNLRIMSQGLVAWFSVEGDTTFGLEYPVITYGPGSPPRSPASADPGPARAPGALGGAAESLNRLAVREAGADGRQEISVADAPGLAAAVASGSGLLVYEIKVPLRRNNQHPYAIGTDTGRVVGLSLEIPYIASLKEPREGGEGPRRSGGGGGMGGGIGGGTDGGMGGGMGGGSGGRRHGGGGRPQGNRAPTGDSEDSGAGQDSAQGAAGAGGVALRERAGTVPGRDRPRTV